MKKYELISSISVTQFIKTIVEMSEVTDKSQNHTNDSYCSAKITATPRLHTLLLNVNRVCRRWKR